jgi:hypothetical protein
MRNLLARLTLEDLQGEDRELFFLPLLRRDPWIRKGRRIQRIEELKVIGSFMDEVMLQWIVMF